MTRLLRRGFLDLALRGGVAAVLGWVLYPILRYIFPPPQAAASETSVVAAKVGELAPNTGKVFAFGDHPAILVNTPAGELRAFTAVCTHLQCTVQYRPDEGVIWCACHNGRFDLNGQVISGPPPRPLEPHRVIVQSENVIVSRG